MLNYKWNQPNRKLTSQEKDIIRKLKLSPILVKLLCKRGINTPDKIHRFLNPGFQNLGNPYKMHDMKKGINLIKSTIAKNEKITIYGDYDTDGITATTIMYKGIKHMYPKANVQYFTPDRFKDGYGPNWDEYERIIDNGTKLLITVDNGIMGKNIIDKARKKGLNVIITDHHDFPDKAHMPNANAIIMAKYPGHQYNPDKNGNSKEDFCGAGIAFKIISALWGRIPKELAYIAALGTIADSVSLTYEDRDIVYEGVKEINHTNSKGIIAIAKKCMGQNWQDKLAKIQSHDLSFNIIPRLNALGRMGSAMNGVRLFLTNDSSYAAQLADITEQSNRKRRKLQGDNSKEAVSESLDENHKNDPVQVLANKNWFPGTVGIVAQHVKEATYKPALVIGHLSEDPDDVYRGSGRSIEGFDLNAHMQQARKYLVSEGGHPMACGFTVKKQQIPKLKATLEENSKKELAHTQPELNPDIKLNISDINENTLHDLEKLEPFGVDNQVPNVLIKVPRIYGVKNMGSSYNYMQLRLTQDWQTSPKVISFKLGKLVNTLANNPYNIEIIGNLKDNYYRGQHSVEVVMTHVRHFDTVPSVGDFGNLYQLLSTESKKNNGEIRCTSLNNLADMIKDQRIRGMQSWSNKKLVKMLEVFEDAHAGKFNKSNQVYYVNNNPAKFPIIPLKQNHEYQEWLSQNN